MTSLRGFLRHFTLVTMIASCWAPLGAARPQAPHQIDLSGWHDSEARREFLRYERTATRTRLGISPKKRSAAADTHGEPNKGQSGPVELFLYAYDTAFYDRQSRCYRIDALLDEGEREFGGYDQILLWQPYPRFGICPRTQWEIWQDMPGGLPALRAIVKRCHERGVKVLLNYIRWDANGVVQNWTQGAQENYAAHGRELALLLEATGADGIFGDTLKDCPSELRLALDRIRPGLHYEGEYAPENEHLGPFDASWTQGLRPMPLQPPRLRWTDPAFRWRFVHRGTDRHDWMIAQAMFWGAGVVVWENVFGWWNPYRARARAFLRRAAPLLRAHADAFSDPQWEPLEAPLAPGVHGNRWRAGEKTVITLLNENETTMVINVPLRGAGNATTAVYDAWNGTVLSPRDGDMVSVAVEGRAPGMILLTSRGATEPVLARPYRAFDPIVENARRRVQDDQEIGAVWIQRRKDNGQIWNERLAASETALLVEESGFRTRVTSDAMQPRPVLPAMLATTPGTPAPSGMVRVPGGRFFMQVRHQARWREGGCYHEPNETSHASEAFWMKPYYLDRCAVSRADYRAFLASTGYRPIDVQNFLRDWIGREAGDTRTWQPPKGTENWPVTWIDLEDARAYAAWAGKRLPREEEWQYAAQGSDSRSWPWGSEWDPARCQHGRPTPSPVDAYPESASPFGCLGMTGNVWEWTESERHDGHTRYAILRGGSHFILPTSYWGKMWYAAEGAQPCDAHEKMPLMAPGLDRSANIGFRCAADVAPGH